MIRKLAGGAGALGAWLATTSAALAQEAAAGPIKALSLIHI